MRLNDELVIKILLFSQLQRLFLFNAYEREFDRRMIDLQPIKERIKFVADSSTLKSYSGKTQATSISMVKMPY